MPAAARSASSAKYAACRRAYRRRHRCPTSALGHRHAASPRRRIASCRSAAHGHHRLVDKPGQQIECVVAGPHRPLRTRRAPRPGRIHRRTPKPCEQGPLGLGQQPVGPVDRRGEALLPRQRPARTTAQQTQSCPSVGPRRGCSSRAFGPRPTRSPAAGRRVADRSRPPRRQAHTRGRSPGGRPWRGRRTTRWPPQPPAGERRKSARLRRPTLRDWWRGLSPGTVLDDPVDQPRAGVKEMLTVVEDQQQFACRQVFDDRRLDVESLPLL